MTVRISRFITAAAASVGVSTLASADFTYNDFSSTEGLILVQDAATFGDVLRLTSSNQLQGGAAWFAVRQHVGRGFTTEFEFRVSELDSIWNPDLMGGDGFAFVIQSDGESALGELGGEQGYGGIRKSIAIEFDTWKNSEYRDPDENHISIHTAGQGPNSADHSFSIGSTSNIPSLSDESIHHARIVYVPGRMTVYVDHVMVLEGPVDFEELAGLEAWVGFTAATWNAWENHDILNWSFRSDLTLVIDGSCPGTVNLVANGATPHDRVAFAYGFQAGHTQVPACPGVTMDIRRARLAGIVQADHRGRAELAGDIPVSVCGEIVAQAIDLGTCRKSSVARP